MAGVKAVLAAISGAGIVMCVSREFGGRLELSLLRKAEISERTRHKNAKPTHPERNTPPADLYLPPQDNPEKMRYRHNDKQRGGQRNVSFLAHSRVPLAWKS